MAKFLFTFRNASSSASVFLFNIEVRCPHPLGWAAHRRPHAAHPCIHVNCQSDGIVVRTSSQDGTSYKL
jgi:hypothetical protein